MTERSTNTSYGEEMLDALIWAEELLRSHVQPTIKTIPCVTHLQAVIHRAKRMKKAGTL